MIKPIDSKIDKLKLLQAQYTANLPAEMDKLEEKWKTFSNVETDIEILRSLYAAFHKLAGSAATFGLTSLSSVARSLEYLVKDNVEKQTSLEGDQHAQISLLLESLRAATAESEITDDVLLVNTSKQLSKVLPSHLDSRIIFLVTDEEELSSCIKKQVSVYGYEVRVYKKFDEYKAAIKKDKPMVTIMNINYLHDEEMFHEFEELKQLQDEELSVIFLSDEESIETRVKAVRAGALGFFVRPVNTNALIDKLESLVDINDTEPFRVLIVDDSTYLSSHYALILEQVGMVTQVVNNPLEIMEHLVNFNPELILLDIHMPECDGTELAKVIRQQESFVSVPIVYLSGEMDVVKQLDAMSIGGDDFMTKPVGPVYLLSTVTNRIKRSRILRSFMVKDSLTGLLNHTRIKEMLVLEIDRARRSGSPLSYAMIDIDRFKTVNDCYGHPAGDQVIKQLSSLLRQRLRRTDIIGRYGGEEFAVILIDADGQAAQRILNEVREGFENILHCAGDDTFKVTLSCGIATFPEKDDAGLINDAADKALYVAKNNGRNKVVMFEDI